MSNGTTNNASLTSNSTEYWPGYASYAAAAAVPLYQPFVDYLGKTTTNALQYAYNNYLNGGAPTAPQAGHTQTGLTVTVTPPASYMPSQPVGMPVTALSKNVLDSASGGAAFQPSAQAWLPAPAAHDINVRAAPNGAVTFSDLMAMTRERLAQLTPRQQEAVNLAIMRSSAGFPARSGRKLAEFYFQYSVGPDNMFSPEAANLFMERFDDSFERYLEYPLSESAYRTIRPQLSDLGDHALRTTQQLKTQFNPLSPRFLRASMFDGYNDALSAVGQGGSFDYGNVTPSSIYDHARTLKQVDRIQQGYNLITDDIIGGTNRPYGQKIDCPNFGLINWLNKEQFTNLAPSGTVIKVPNWTWYKPWTYRDTDSRLVYPQQIIQQFYDGTVVGVLPGKFTFDGTNWGERETNNLIEAARVAGMQKYIEQQNRFFQIGSGLYPNCRADEIGALKRMKPGQVVPRT
ncbi:MULTISPECIES: hypothetical protein [unclassified Acidisoma]|uniref:hypothetical protein n=1 Tax=unclassified Acidisoma TaxID=2634065 RepID=UPI00131D13AF|nr:MULTISPECIES: hypothetical protein [unclassified Acidisoma]